MIEARRPQQGSENPQGMSIRRGLENFRDAFYTKIPLLNEKNDKIAFVELEKDQQTGEVSRILTWRGIIPPAELDSGIRSISHAIFGKAVNSEDEASRQHIYAALTVYEKTETPKGKDDQRFTVISQTKEIAGVLSDPETYKEYTKVQKYPLKLSSIEFDVVDPTDTSRHFAFTAKNADSQHFLTAKLQIIQSGDAQVWNDKLMQWVFRKHIDPINRTIDPQQAAEIIKSTNLNVIDITNKE